jgi:NPCBM/NEW2 domain/Protein of unknown function (DUF1583)
MQATILLLIAMTGAGGGEYSRSLASSRLDQPTLDAEGYGETKSIHREDDGLRVILAPGAKETGWKTPQQMRFGGDFTLSAGFVVKKLPKPAIEDGVAIGLAIAFNDVTQPDVTFIRLLETNGSDVYRAFDKASTDPNQMQNQMMMQMQMGGMVMMRGGMPPGGKPPKPPRRTFPAAGESFRLELQREGQVIRFQVLDGKSTKARYLGQVTLGPMDVAAVKLFVVNRNGAEPINVLFKDFKLRADRISGLGATVRSVFGEIVYGEPTSIENGVLVIGGQPAGPTPGANPAAMSVASPAAGMVATRVRAGRVAVAAPAGGVVMMAAPAQVVAAPAQAAPAPVVQAAAPAQAAGANTPPAAAKPADAKPPTDVFAADAPPSSVFADPSQAGALAAVPKPKAKIPLDEVESIRFERTPTLTARLIGQPNLDFTMPAPSAPTPDDPAKKPADAEKKAGDKKPDGSDDLAAPAPGTTVVRMAKVEAKKNGIRDLHIALFGLRPAKIRQVMVNCQTDKGATSWQLDTTGSQSWPLVIHRAGTEISADLFLEPPPGDCHQKNFTINVNYEDNQAANANFQADKHSDPKLAVDPKTPGAETLDAWVYLTDDEKLFGKLGDVANEKLHLATPWNDQLEIPIARIAAVHIGLLDRKETPESFAKRMKTRGTEDLLLAQTRKGEVVAIPGVLEGIKGDRLSFLYQGKPRTLPIKQVEGVIIAARPESRSQELRPTFMLAGDVAVSGKWKAMEGAVWKVESPWGQEMKLPSAEVQGVRFRGGKMTYLSDMEPTKVEEASYFGHRFPWRRNVSLTGGKLTMNGETYERGLAVHSRSTLTYDLNGRFETFETLVGFDDAVRGKGRVACRIFADDKELYSNPDLRADAPPVPLKLSVASAQQLRLEIDYGREQDTGDRVIWADARLYRPTSPKADVAASR